MYSNFILAVHYILVGGIYCIFELFMLVIDCDDFVDDDLLHQKFPQNIFYHFGSNNMPIWEKVRAQKI